MLKFVNFKKGYTDFPVLKIDDLIIERGIYWIKGGNGSGKSTLLKAIAGILHFEGDILLNSSISIKKQTLPYRKLVNFAEAEPVFPEFLTGREMILMFSRAKGAPRGQEDEYIESMRMQPYIDLPLGTYSSGMLKKLSLVLAFIGNPELILLDEPLITIDVESLATLYSWITKKYERDNTSFILASHQSLYDAGLPVFREALIELQQLKFI
jgi:ABC-2 type transport system ATP-binding protein